MDLILENHILKIGIREKGAELLSVYHKRTRLEYMWSGDPSFWGKTSPILFPIVGALKGNTFHIDNKAYSLSRHGFARDQAFEVESKTIDQVSFRIESSLDSLKVYPYSFSLRVTYQLNDSTLTVTYDVINEGNTTMLFSLGAHPAFKVPLVDDTAYSDYLLEFNSTESSDAWKISPEGLITGETRPMLKNTSRLPLDKSLFYGDALVFKNLQSDSISVRSSKHSHGLDFAFAGFPFFGIWAAKDADFVCLEPWCGIADSVGHNQQFSAKEGLEKISPGQLWTRNWSIKCY